MLTRSYLPVRTGVNPGSGLPKGTHNPLLNRGGAIGRNPVLHMGMGVQRGGVNTVGSVRRGSGFSDRANPLVGAAPRQSAAPTPTLAPPLDYRTVPGYAEHVAQANADYALGAAPLTSQLSELPALFDRQSALQQRALQQDIYGSNTNLANRGLLFSGGEKQAETDFNNRNQSEQASLSDAYGANAQARIAAQIAALANARDLGVNAAETEAKLARQSEPALPEAASAAVVNPLKVVVKSKPVRPVRAPVKPVRGVVGGIVGPVRAVGKLGVKPGARR